jgi:hypothetical protein
MVCIDMLYFLVDMGSYDLTVPPNAVGITLYLLLTAEYLLRLHFKKPLQSISPAQSFPSETYSIDNEKVSELVVELNGRRVVSWRLFNLMITGMVIATMFILMRCVAHWMW